MEFKKVRKGFDPISVNDYIARLLKEHADTTSDLRIRVAEQKTELARIQRELDDFRARERAIGEAFIAAKQHAEEMERASSDVYQNELDNLRQFHARWTEYYRQIIEKYPVDDELINLQSFMEKMTALFSEGGKGKETGRAVRKKREKPAPPRAPSAQFESETERLRKNIQEAAEELGEDAGYENVLSKIAGTFDPVRAIREYYERRGASVPETADAAPPAETAPQSPRAPRVHTTVDPNELGVSDSGFDFNEALNPTESLEDILKGLL